MVNDYLKSYCSRGLMIGGTLHELNLLEMRTLNSLRVHESEVDCVLEELSLFARPEKSEGYIRTVYRSRLGTFKLAMTHRYL